MIDLITDKNGLTWICFTHSKTVKPEPTQRKKTRSKI